MTDGMPQQRSGSMNYRQGPPPSMGMGMGTGIGTFTGMGTFTGTAVAIIGATPTLEGGSWKMIMIYRVWW